MIISNETLNGIAQAISDRNTYLSMISEIVGTGRKYVIGDWTPVSAMIQAGTAQTKFPLGTQFISTYTDASGKAWEMPWDVVHYGDVELADGTTKKGMYLQSHYATIEAVQFDAPEPNSADNNIKQYGYNRWSQSVYRQWLNSDAIKGNWWTAQSETDVAPTQLNSYNGFLNGLDNVFKGAIAPVKVQTACNTATDGGEIDTTVDKIFLPSIEQMYGAPQLAGAEGEYWHYWKMATGFEIPKNDSNDGRKIFGLDSKTTAQNCRLRSAYRGASYYVWNVYTTGTLLGSIASYAYRCAPACVIV